MSDPLNVTIHYRLARYAYFLGRLDEAVASFTKVLELNPEYPAAHQDLALVYLAQSRPGGGACRDGAGEAGPRGGASACRCSITPWGARRRPTRRSRSSSRTTSDTAAYQIAEVYAYRGEVDRAFEWLERAYAQRDSGLSQIKGDPHFKRLERRSALCRPPREDAPAAVKGTGRHDSRPVESGSQETGRAGARERPAPSVFFLAASRQNLAARSAPRETPAACGCATGGAACAAPWPRSGGCARG